jgi:hypothetical protein
MQTENLPILSNLTPIIQFMAGVYLLFFYEKFFKENALFAQLEPLKEKIKNLPLKYQGFKNHEILAVSELLQDGWDKKWASLVRVFVISFSYCIFLLICIGCEGYLKSGTSLVENVLAVAFFVIAYIICCLFFVKRYLFLRPLIWIVICFFAFWFASSINFVLDKILCIDIKDSLISIFLFLTALSGAIVGIFKVSCYYCKIKICDNKIDELSLTIKHLLEYQLLKDIKQLTNEEKKHVTEILFSKYTKGEGQITTEKLCEEAIKTSISEKYESIKKYLKAGDIKCVIQHIFMSLKNIIGKIKKSKIGTLSPA